MLRALPENFCDADSIAQGLEDTDLTDYTVEVSDSALMHLCIAGLESYVVPNKPKEVFCLLWGSVSKKGKNEIYYRIDHVFTDIEAKRKKDSVEYNDEGLGLKQEIIDGCWPTQTFLGDFHTHPCNERKEIELQCGLSGGDRKDIEGRSFWYDKGLKVSMVMAIYKMKRSPRKEHKRINNYKILWTLENGYRFGLAAYVANRVSSKKKLFLSPRETGWPDPSVPGGHRVWLDIPSVLGSSSFNYRRD